MVVLGPESAMMVGRFLTEIRRSESCGHLQEECCGQWRRQRQRPKDGMHLNDLKSSKKAFLSRIRGRHTGEMEERNLGSDRIGMMSTLDFLKAALVVVVVVQSCLILCNP